MTTKEKFDKLVGNLNNIAENVFGSKQENPQVEEETTETPELKSSIEDKVNEMHNLFFTDVDDDEVEVVDEENQENMQQENEVPIADVPTPEVKQETPAVEDSKQEEVQEESINYKQELEAKEKELEKLKKQMAKKEEEVKDDLIHNPEAETRAGNRFVGGDPQTAPDDPTSAFFHILGE